MKVCIIQPYYSFDYQDSEKCFSEMIKLIDKCDDSLDIIVLPEYCDIPTATPNRQAFLESIEKYNDIIKKKVSDTAKRCNALVFANYGEKTENGYANVTHAFDRCGREIGKYFKAHPAPSEVKSDEQGGNGMDCSYSYSYREPYVIEAEGIRFGFLTCYDFYMYESFAKIARSNVDIIIGCSHQRTDSHDALETIGKFLSYNTNSYLIRSAVSLGKDSEVCGCSMVVSPEGKMLLNMKNDVGLSIIEIDPKDKYYKPAGFQGAELAHYQYIDEGRRPWLYRPAGSMMVPPDDFMPYPRVCAHRGFNSIAPENSMPAFGAAIALGACEIEFDIWATKDKKLISIHDNSLERVSDGTGNVWDYTYDELLKFDFSKNCDEHYKGIRIVKFEDILKKFACTTIMNIHVKIWDEEQDNPMYEEIAGLLRQYDCEKHCYIMTTSDKCSKEFHKIAPEINRCVGFNGNTDPKDMVKRAIELKAQKVQFFAEYLNQEAIEYAHKNGIICNLFQSDKPSRACELIDMGIDTILTNDYLSVSNAVNEHIKQIRK